MLTENEHKFLLSILDGGSMICNQSPPSERLQSLVKRGYCYFSEALCGPLSVKTGETMISLTECGKLYLKDHPTTEEFSIALVKQIPLQQKTKL